MLSTVVVFSLLGVVCPMAVINSTAPLPIGWRQQERRICAVLCKSGFGGEPCGESCEDLLPKELLNGGLQLKPGSNESLARRDACPLLCANKLGYPLCNCEYDVNNYKPFFQVDFYRICSHFCHAYKYCLDGCISCDFYPSMNPMVALASGEKNNQKYDWNGWCITMCKKGEGGSACYCDLLPMSMHV